MYISLSITTFTKNENVCESTEWTLGAPGGAPVGTAPDKVDGRPDGCEEATPAHPQRNVWHGCSSGNEGSLLTFLHN